VADPACTMYEVGASPPTGALQFSATVDPLTVADKPVGADGALTAAAVRNRDVVTRAGGHPDEPNVPIVSLTCVKHDHETDDAPRFGPVVPVPCATLMAVDGAAGERFVPPPHADINNMATRVVVIAVDRPRIGASRAAGRAILKNGLVFRQIDGTMTEFSGASSAGSARAGCVRLAQDVDDRRAVGPIL